MSAIKLTYFQIRGLGEPIRVILEDLGIKYENIYAFSDSNWPEMKKEGTENGKLAFGQIPLYEDGDVCMVESMAIVRHLGRLHGLYGASLAEHALVDVVIDAHMDWRSSYVRLVYTDRLSEEAKAAYKKTIAAPAARGGSGWLHYFERWLAEKNKANKAKIEAAAASNTAPSNLYVVGNSITIADYMLFDLCDTQLRVFPSLLDGLDGVGAPTPLLKAFYDGIKARPALAAYIATNPLHRQKANNNGLG